tara:strand:- start:20 stop:496 length:477 start_codon:yes stop_codon:yes gene_type:complete
MAKNIQWKKSTIDYELLNKLNPRVISCTERGNLNVKLGKIGAGIGTYESRSRGQKNSVANQIKSGKMAQFQKIGTDAAAITSKQKKIERKQRFFNLVKSEFGNNDFNLLELSHLDVHFPESNNTNKLFRHYLSESNVFKFIGYKNKSKRYKFETKGNA